jgi:uncharacterized damage-inducible protein DinB
MSKIGGLELMLDTVHRLVAYNGWADKRAIESVRTGLKVDPKVFRSLAHLLVAEKVWLMRLLGQETVGIDLSPELSLEECEILVAENQHGYEKYLGTLTSANLDSLITYQNSKGKTFQTSVRDILLHLLFHGAYHRGQLASAIRAQGQTPVNTDFITFVRKE